jgi:hypothetical protein
MHSNAAHAFNALSLETMASGHLCLNLSDSVPWDGFSDFARFTLSKIGGACAEVIEGPDTIIWKVHIGERAFQLVFDDYPVTVSLESNSDEDDVALRDIYDQLRATLK